MAEQAKKAAPKRKTTAKRKPAARKTTARKTAPRKAAAKKVSTLQDRVTEASRNAFLASLGFYGMAYDQMQDQLKSVEGEISDRRKKADKLYTDMVKRGQKVEKQAKTAIDDIEMPKFEVPSFDRARLEDQLDKARARFEELKESVSFKKAA